MSDERAIRTPKPSDLPIGSYWNAEFTLGDQTHTGTFIITRHKNGTIFGQSVTREEPNPKEIAFPRRLSYWELSDWQKRKYVPPAKMRLREKRRPPLCPANTGVTDPVYAPWRDIRESYSVVFAADNVYFSREQLSQTLSARTQYGKEYPFLVAAHETNIEIYGDEHPLIYDEQPIYNVLVKRYTEFEGIWFGKNTNLSEIYNAKYGGTILIKLSENKYVYIADQVIEFEAPHCLDTTPITNFVSPIIDGIPRAVAWSNGDSLSKGVIYFLGELSKDCVRKKINLYVPCTGYTSVKMFDEFRGTLPQKRTETLSNMQLSNIVIIASNPYDGNHAK